MKQKKLKYIAKINRDVLNNSTADDYVFNYIDISSIGTGDIKQDLIELSFAESPSRARRIVHVGDTIISTVRTYLKSVYHFEVIDTNTIASTGFAVLTPNKGVHPKYLYYSVLSNDFIEDVCSRSTGVSYPAISEWGLGQIPIFIWDYSEQKKIASFLDQKCARIDALIEKKQKFVELKKKKRTALINQAVTKGLDPNVPMKDSGIEWLGEIPKHWEVKKIKYLARNVVEKISPTESDLKIALENLESNTGKFIQSENGTSFEGDGLLFQTYDVLFNKLRPYLSKVYLATEVGICVSELLVLRTESEITPKFLFYRVLSEQFISLVNNSTYGAKMPRANWEFIGNLEIAYPSHEEQLSISNKLQDYSNKIDTYINKSNEHIELLKEYKTTLISEAVTGKIIPA